MNLKVAHFGDQTKLVRQPNDTYRQMVDGSIEAVIQYKCPYDRRINLMPKAGDKHPDIPTLKLYEFGGEREEGNIYRFDCIYRGVNANVDTWFLMQEEVTVDTSQEPVETHWKFSYPWNNPPVTPSDLAQITAALEANLGTPPTGFVAGTPRYELWLLRRRGIDSYRMMSINARLSYTLAVDKPPTPEFIVRVGTTNSETTARTRATTLPKTTARDYLFSGLSWKKAGGAIIVTEQHSLSGPNKWHPYLYAATTQ